MAEMRHRGGGPPALPADHAFVVQFRAGAGRAEAGRAEHLVSGRAGTFTSWGELRAFVEDVLAQHDAGDGTR